MKVLRRPERFSQSNQSIKIPICVAPCGIAEFAGLEFAGLENDGLENDALE